MLTGIALSVSISMSDINFSPYFRQQMQNGPDFVVHDHPTRQPPLLPHRITTDRSQNAMTYSGLPSQDTMPPSHFQTQPQPVQQYTLGVSPSTVFDKSYQYSIEPYGAAKATPISTFYQYRVPVHFPFRPMDSTQEAYPTTMIPNPLKIESMPQLPTPSVLPWKSDVDVRMYEEIPLGDWLTGAAEYEGTSPASVETFETSPITPGTQDGDIFPDSYPHNLSWDLNEGYSLSDVGAPFFSNSAPEIRYSGPFSPSFLRDSLTAASRPSGLLPPISSTFRNDIVEAATAAPQEVEPPMEMDSDGGFEPYESPPESPESGSHTSSPSGGEPESRQRCDEYLLEMREAGHSYKEIKRRGRFRQAESTLRGRIRVLTKEKWERVRKPRWSANDVSQSGVTSVVFSCLSHNRSSFFVKRSDTSRMKALGSQSKSVIVLSCPGKRLADG